MFGMKDLKLSEHFWLSEFTRSGVAEARGIVNVPDVVQVANLCRLCREVLEPLRVRFGCPVRINSGFRSRELNVAVGGAVRSLHMEGRAADIPFRPGWLAYIRDCLPHRELINEVSGDRHWIHVGL